MDDESRFEDLRDTRLKVWGLRISCRTGRPKKLRIKNWKEKQGAQSAKDLQKKKEKEIKGKHSSFVLVENKLSLRIKSHYYWALKCVVTVIAHVHFSNDCHPHVMISSVW